MRRCWRATGSRPSTTEPPPGSRTSSWARISPSPDWSDIRGARWCTPQSCAFRDHVAELAERGASVAGLSAQTLDDQDEFADRNHIAYPVVADPELRLGQALRLPTFEVEGVTLYKRITLVVEAC